MTTNYLCHYGVPGMKWGVRQAREAGRDLDRKRRLYKQARLARNLSVMRGESGVSVGYKTDNYKKAKDDYRQAKKEFRENAPAQAKAQRGATKAAVALAKVGALYVVDKKVFGGAGAAVTKIAAEAAVKAVGMTAITAFSLARGDTNLKWIV